MRVLALVFIILMVLIGTANAFTPFQAIAKQGCLAFAQFEGIVAMRESIFKNGLDHALRQVPGWIAQGKAFMVPTMMRVTVDDLREYFYHITLPDGRDGWILKNAVY